MSTKLLSSRVTIIQNIKCRYRQTIVESVQLYIITSNWLNSRTMNNENSIKRKYDKIGQLSLFDGIHYEAKIK